MTFAVALTAVPLSCGLAIMRYRLYEIDRIISRTIAYALVTGTLLLVYFGVVTSVTRLLPRQSSSFAVAGATLTAAALFRPLLTRIQRLVDHRFNRTRYDAERTVEGFAAGLRDETDEAAILGRLNEALDATMQPATAVVWLRQARRDDPEPRPPQGRHGAVGAAVGVLIAGVGLTATAAALVLATHTQDSSATVLLGIAPWYLVGAAIVARRGDNVVGWLFVTIGLTWTTGFVASGYADLPSSAAGPALTWASWYGAWFWIPAIGLPLVLILVFPTGEVPSPAWRPVLIVMLVAFSVGVVRFALAETLQATSAAPEVTNPIGVPGLGRTDFGGEAPILVVLLGSLAAALVSFVVRFRRSNGVERQQLKWMAYLGTPLLVAGWFVGIWLSELGFRLGELIGAARVRCRPARCLHGDHPVTALRDRPDRQSHGVVRGRHGRPACRLRVRRDVRDAAAPADVRAPSPSRPRRWPLRRRSALSSRASSSSWTAASTGSGTTACGQRRCSPTGLRDETDPALVVSEMTAVVQRTLQPERLILWVPQGVTDER